MKHLLSVWPRIAEQIQKAEHVLLLSDYDGTLTPIVEKPDLAILPEDVRGQLETLVNQPRITVGVISGRALADLKQRVNLTGLIYAGNHGFEIEGPGWSFINPIAGEIRPFFHVLHQVLSLALGTIKGTLVENKGVTLSVHYRAVKEDEALQVRTVVERATHSLMAYGKIKVTHGKKVYELRPAVDWDKGKAIRWLMKKYGQGGRQPGLLPIFLGDDLTDEDGFQSIERYGQGVSVHVGESNHTSAAQYYLNSPDEVSEFLEKMVEHSERRLLCEQYSTI